MAVKGSEQRSRQGGKEKRLKNALEKCDIGNITQKVNELLRFYMKLVKNIDFPRELM